jgi:hypothetical protein
MAGRRPVQVSHQSRRTVISCCRTAELAPKNQKRQDAKREACTDTIFAFERSDFVIVEHITARTNEQGHAIIRANATSISKNGLFCGQ